MLETTQPPTMTTLILGSAAIGALVSSLITVGGQYFERRARRKELLLAKAVDLAELQVDFYRQFSNATGKGINIYPYAVYTRIAHAHLKSLYETERLPDAVEEQYRAVISKGTNVEVSD